MTKPDLIRMGVVNYLSLLQNGAAEDLTALFSTDGVIEDPDGSTPKVGHAAIRGHFDLAAQYEIRTELVALRITESAAAVYFRVDTKVGEENFISRPIDVFAFDERGKITSLRTYWGDADYTAPAETVSAARDVQ